MTAKPLKPAEIKSRLVSRITGLDWINKALMVTNPREGVNVRQVFNVFLLKRVKEINRSNPQI